MKTSTERLCRGCLKYTTLETCPTCAAVFAKRRKKTETTRLAIGKRAQKRFVDENKMITKLIVGDSL